MRYVRSLIDAGAIGEIYSARGYGHLGVPPWSGYTSDPSPFFAAGAGPAMDMGVYPLHALTALLGPVQRVSAPLRPLLRTSTDNVSPGAPLQRLGRMTATRS